MSVDGFSPEGTDRLICIEPPGGGGEFVSNVFLGFPWPRTQPPNPAMPSLTPGTGDMALECWARRRFGNSPGADEQFWTGILEDNSGFPDPLVAFRWNNSTDSVGLYFDALGTGAPSAIVINDTPTVPGRWSHYVGNFDRSGNMELFIDGESKGTSAISAQTDSVTGEFHALTADHTFEFHSATFTDWDGVSIFNVMVGPVALHARLLTTAEIHDSYRNRKVQDVSTDLIRFDWRKIEGFSGWDLDQANAMLGHKTGLAVPMGMPQGAADSVTVRDQSGSGNHWTIPMVEDWTTYDTTPDIEDGKWPMAFGSDSFFR